MMIQVNSPTFLTYALLALLCSGLATLAWGKKLPGKGAWLVWAGLLFLLFAVGFDSGLFLKEDFKVKIWKAGWIWSRDDIGAITLGIIQDALGLAIISLSVICAGALLWAQGSSNTKDLYSDKLRAALAFSVAGVALSWISLTPWVLFAGLLLTFLGGFISLASIWESNQEAEIASRYLWERAFGLLSSFLGACILAASRPALLFNDPKIWLEQASDGNSTWIGSILLVVGSFIQFQPFPLQGWKIATSAGSSSLRTLLNQVFPAWAAFPLLLRLHPELQSLGLFPHFGWIALCSSILAIVSGLLQVQWQRKLGAWLVAGFSLSIAYLAFSGPISALGLLLGVSLGANCLVGAASILEERKEKKGQHRKATAWIKFAAVLGAAAATGAIGFVSAAGGIRWLIEVMSFPVMVALFVFVFFIYVLLGWKLTWQFLRVSEAKEVGWLSVCALFVWPVLALGIVWTGTITGEVLPNDSDRVIPSLFGLFFNTDNAQMGSSPDFLTASMLYWGALVVGFLTALWMAGRQKEGVQGRWKDLMPRTVQFIVDGYGMGTLAQEITRGMIWFGRVSQQLIDVKVWSVWIPEALAGALKGTSQVVNGIDFRIAGGLGELLRRFVDVPAKVLQLIQTGDLRWYLFFALGSGFAMLFHFIKT